MYVYLSIIIYLISFLFITTLVLIPNQDIPLHFMTIYADSQDIGTLQNNISNSLISNALTRVGILLAENNETGQLFRNTSNIETDIAIMGSGINSNNSFLNVYRNATFVPGTTSGNDICGHGSEVAAIVAAKDNNNVIVGMAPGARLWDVKVLGDECTGSTVSVLEGINYVTQHADEIDIALLTAYSYMPGKVLESAIERSAQTGVTYIIPAGNDNFNSTAFRDIAASIIKVSGIVDTDGKCGGLGPPSKSGKDDSFAAFSNYGPDIDIAAPSVEVPTLINEGNIIKLSGTSQAAALVAGAAAIYKANNPQAISQDILSALLASGSTPQTPCDGDGRGYFTGDPDPHPEPLLYVKDLAQ